MTILYISYLINFASHYKIKRSEDNSIFIKGSYNCAHLAPNFVIIGKQLNVEKVPGSTVIYLF